MVLPAVAGALVVTATGLHALGAPLRAGVVWQGECVFRDVGSLAIAADTAVGEIVLGKAELAGEVPCQQREANDTYRITGVDQGRGRILLLADQGASAQFTGTPSAPGRFWHRVWADIVVCVDGSYKCEYR